MVSVYKVNKLKFFKLRELFNILEGLDKVKYNLR